MATSALGTASASSGFRFDSGRICLDLLATAHPEERLDTVERLRDWVTGEGLVPLVPGGAGVGGRGGVGVGVDAARLRGSGRAAVAPVAPGPVDAAPVAVESAAGAGVAGSGAAAGPGRPAAGPAPSAGVVRERVVEQAVERAVLPGADALWLVALRELRGHIGALVRGELDGRPSAVSLERVNALAREAPPAPCAVRGADGKLIRALHAEPECGALLALFARDAVELLTDPAARGRLRRCEGDNCPLIYLDTSRGRRRRWCSSEACGNRERVARHRRRAALARA